MAQRQATIVQDYQTFALIADQLFGGGSAKTPDAPAPKTESELQSAFKGVFG